MRKATIIIIPILIIAIAVIFFIRQSYKNSPDYNFISAKLDIRNGNAKIVHIGFRKISSKDREIDSVTEKYGFKNIYIGYDTTKQIKSGVKNYNDVIETYLKLRNGRNWEKSYQWEIDSLYKASSIQSD